MRTHKTNPQSVNRKRRRSDLMEFNKKIEKIAENFPKKIVRDHKYIHTKNIALVAVKMVGNRLSEEESGG